MNAKSPSTSKHTPGPWVFATSNPPEYFDVIAGDRIVAEVLPYIPMAHGHDRLGSARANARLIAAAPELLEALYVALPIVEDACEFMKDDFKPGVLSRLKAQIRAAIAKAEGGTNV